MPFDWGRVLGDLRSQWIALSAGRRAAIVGLLLAGTLGFLGLVYWVQRPVFAPIYRGSSKQEAAKVVELLREASVPYRLTFGTWVEVPEHLRGEWELRLAQSGLVEDVTSLAPAEDLGGMSLWETEEDKARRFVREREIQLARILAQSPDVERAVVNLTAPRRSSFADLDRPPEAAVVLTLRAGRRVGGDQVRGIQSIVASSVDGLDVEHVVVTDDKGRLLSRPGDGEGIVSGEQLDLQARVDAFYVAKIEELLAPIFSNKYRAVVTSDLNFKRIAEETSEELDSDNRVVRKESIRSMQSQATPSSGEVGTAGELGGTTPGASGGLTTEDDTTAEYEIPRTVRRVVDNARYYVNSLSVALFLHKSLEGERQEVENLVKGAVSFDQSRGDQFYIGVLDFEPAPLPGADPVTNAVRQREFILTLVRYGAEALSVLAVVTLLLILMRRALGSRTARVRTVEKKAAALGPVNGESEPRAPEKADEQEDLLRRMTARADKNPEAAARLVKHWLAQN